MKSEREKEKRFHAVRACIEWPDIDQNAPHMRETYIGLGKSIVVETILKWNLSNLLEVGSFLGASIDFWLNACSRIHIVAVDPWLDGWAGTHCHTFRYNEKCLLNLGPASIDYLNKDNGLYKTFLANMRQHHNRLIPVRSTIQDAIPLLKNAGYIPDIIYLDANKSYELLEALWQAWPEAILSGDDYRWKDAKGNVVMRDHVNRFANLHDMSVLHKQDTWMLLK